MVPAITAYPAPAEPPPPPLPFEPEVPSRPFLALRVPVAASKMPTSEHPSPPKPSVPDSPSSPSTPSRGSVGLSSQKKHCPRFVGALKVGSPGIPPPTPKPAEATGFALATARAALKSHRPATVKSVHPALPQGLLWSQSKAGQSAAPPFPPETERPPQVCEPPLPAATRRHASPLEPGRPSEPSTPSSSSKDETPDSRRRSEAL